MGFAILLLFLTVQCYAAIDQQKVTDALNNLVRQDFRLDGYTVINYQNMASHKDFHHDNAKKPLFKHVPESSINRVTFKKLNDLLTFYNQPDANEPEVYTESWEQAISSFLYTVMKTDVMKSAQKFLAGLGLASMDTEEFKAQLTSLWFTPYSRGAAPGSSGFEALFAGETQNGDVIRFANWYRFYQLEKQGRVNYHGWFQKQPNVQLSQQFEWGSWKAQDLSMLLNTSPEFEMAAYTICALTGGECEFTVNGDDVNIVAKTIKQGDELVIDDCHPYVPGAITHRPNPGKGSTKKPKPSDEKFQTLVDRMREADVDRAGPADYKLNWGNRASGNSDVSDNDLFVYVNETLFERPVYATLLALIQRNVFRNDVCEKEPPMSGLRKTQIQLMLDTWTNTEVFRLAFDYMQAKGEKHATNFESFKKFLFDFWFGTYSRCQGPVGSSGFEHVFTGEWKRGTVGGHHSWVTYYAAQKAGKINYHGYFSTVSDLAGTFQYRWQNVFKKKGGFLFGTSPAFDFSLFTVCSLMYPGTAGCRYSIDGYSLGVTSFTQSCSAGLCLATAYPIN